MAEFVELSDDNFEDLLAKSEKAMVDFYASWCGNCRMAAPMFKKMATEAHLDLFKIDVEKNPKIKAMLSLPGLPSIGLFQNGEPVDVISTTKEEALRDFLKNNEFGSWT